jgi:hypothetical protein
MLSGADDPNILKMLPPDDLAKFQKLVDSGDIGSMLVLWRPWWETRQTRAAISVVSDPADASSDDMDIDSDAIPIPSRLESIPPFETLLKTSPSPKLAFHLVELIYCYAYLMRLYNGDWDDDPRDVQRCLIDLSDVLHRNAVHESAAMALRSCIHNSMKVRS